MKNKIIQKLLNLSFSTALIAKNGLCPQPKRERDLTSSDDDEEKKTQKCVLKRQACHQILLENGSVYMLSLPFLNCLSVVMY